MPRNDFVKHLFAYCLDFKILFINKGDILYSNIKHNSSGANLGNDSDKEENTCQGNTLVAAYLMHPFSASISDDTPKEAIFIGLAKLHMNKNSFRYS